MKKILSSFLCVLVLIGLFGCTNNAEQVPDNAAVSSTDATENLVIKSADAFYTIGETPLHVLVDNGIQFKDNLEEMSLEPLERSTCLYLVNEESDVTIGFHVINTSDEIKCVLECPITGMRIYRPKDCTDAVGYTFCDVLSLENTEEEVRNYMGDPYLFNDNINEVGELLHALNYYEPIGDYAKVYHSFVFIDGTMTVFSIQYRLAD